MKNQVLRAIYIVSKIAKHENNLKFEVRQAIKSVVFHRHYGPSSLNTISDEGMNILRAYGIHDIGPYYDSYDKEYYTSKDIAQAIEDSTSGDSYYEFLEFLNAEYSDEIPNNDGVIYNQDLAFESLDSLRDEGYGESILNAIQEYQSYINELETIEDQINKLHEFLKYGYDKRDIFKENLMLLKQCAIESLGIEPVAYHRLAHTDESVLAYYMIDGFKYHIPITVDELEESLAADVNLNDVIEDITIDKISEKIQLNDEDILSIEDAIDILLTHLSITLDHAQIISGEVRLTEVTGKSVNHIQYERNNYCEDRWHDDDYDNDYDDGYDDDYNYFEY